jgi:predicted PurR-regulated permease PerM
MSSLRPGVNFLVSKKFPRGLAVGVVFTLFLLFFASLISVIIPPIVYETTNLMKSLPSIIEQSAPLIEDYVDVSSLTTYAPNITNNILDVISSVFSNTLFIMATLFFSLYFLIEENLANSFLAKYLKKDQADKVDKVLSLAEKRMASWFWGEVILMTVVGVVTYIGLSLLGVKYALPLAVLAGLLEIVPNIGPIIAAVPAVLIGFSTSLFTGVSALALYVVVQQLENNLIVPVIMKKAVGINPVITLLALLIGGRFGGVLGVLLGIPLILFIETAFQEFRKTKKQ